MLIAVATIQHPNDENSECNVERSHKAHLSAGKAGERAVRCQTERAKDGIEAPIVAQVREFTALTWALSNCL